MGCRTEPAAVHIAHVLQRLHFFKFFNFFFIIYAPLPQKKSIFFYKTHDLPQTKSTHLPQKKSTTRRFFCTRLTFFTCQICLVMPLARETSHPLTTATQKSLEERRRLQQMLVACECKNTEIHEVVFMK